MSNLPFEQAKRRAVIYCDDTSPRILTMPPEMPLLCISTGTAPFSLSDAIFTPSCCSPLMRSPIGRLRRVWSPVSTHLPFVSAERAVNILRVVADPPQFISDIGARRL